MPTIPSANKTKVKITGQGSQGLAASAALWMSVTPPVCKTAAVVRIIKKAITLEKHHAHAGVQCDAIDFGFAAATCFVERLWRSIKYEEAYL